MPKSGIISVSRPELAKLMAHESIGITRYYPGGCEWEPGDTVRLAWTEAPGDRTQRPTIVANAKVMSVRPFEWRERAVPSAAADEEARKEGWENAIVWATFFERLYGELEDADIVHRLQLRIEKRVDQVHDNGETMPHRR